MIPDGSAIPGDRGPSLPIPSIWPFMKICGKTAQTPSVIRDEVLQNSHMGCDLFIARTGRMRQSIHRATSRSSRYSNGGPKDLEARAHSARSPDLPSHG